MILVAKSKKSRRRKAQRIALIVILCVVFSGIMALFISLGYYVSTLTTIFPNVRTEGIDMSERTAEQARQILIANGYEQKAERIAVTVELPHDNIFTISGVEVGMKLDAAEAAQALYNYGRDGNFFSNAITYVQSLLSVVELDNLSLPNYDTTIIRQLAEEYTQRFNDSLYDNSYDIDNDRITIIKGTGYLPAAVDDVYNFAELAMKRAIEEDTRIEVRFLPKTTDGSVIDLQSIYDNIHEEPVESTYDPELGNPNLPTYDRVNKGATPSRVGQTFDLEEAEQMYRDAPDGSTVVIPIIRLEPELSQDQLRDKIFGDILGEREAGQGDNPNNRINNIQLAAEAIDGLIMQPGDSFSFNGIVGQRTAEAGYREANAIVNGVLTPVLGGGICQVSSAIYAALLQTDIEITSRTPHGLRVAYLPGGQDATVAYGSLDFRFRNSTDFPIRLDVETITTTTGYITVSVKIYGTRVSDIYYEVRSIEHRDSPITMTTVERPVTDEDNVTLAPGEVRVLQQGNSGSIWEVWRYHYSDPDFENPDNRILDNNGEHVRTLIQTSTYRMRQRIIVYNPAGSLQGATDASNTQNTQNNQDTTSGTTSDTTSGTTSDTTNDTSSDTPNDISGGTSDDPQE